MLLNLELFPCGDKGRGRGPECSYQQDPDGVQNPSVSNKTSNNKGGEQVNGELRTVESSAGSEITDKGGKVHFSALSFAAPRPEALLTAFISLERKMMRRAKGSAKGGGSEIPHFTSLSSPTRIYLPGPETK